MFRGRSNEGTAEEEQRTKQGDADTIYMLLIYKKSKQEDLTPEQIRVLRNLVKEWFL